MKLAIAMMASHPSCGVAPCAARPAISISHVSTAAIIAPVRQPIVPSGSDGMMCMP